MNRKKERYKYNTIDTMLFTFRVVIRRDKSILPIYLLRITVSLVGNLLGLFFLPSLISLIESKAEQNQIILTVLFNVCGLFLCQIIAQFMQQLYWPRMSRIRVMLSQELDEIMLDMPYEEFENPNEQNRFQTANATIGNANGGIAGTIVYSFELLEEILSLIIYAAISLYINYALFGLIFLVVGINYILTSNVNRKNYENTIQMSQYDRELSWLYQSTVDDSLGKDIRLYKMLPWLKSRINRAFENKRQLQKKNLHHTLQLSVTNIFLTLFSDAAIYGSLILKFIHKAISLSDFTLHFSIIYAVYDRINRIIQYILTLKKFNLSLNDYRSLLVNKREKISKMHDKTSSKKNNISEVKIEFHDVSFCYPNTDTYVLKHISFTINPGERVSLVGENGAGKTTIVRLLCRLYKPSDGIILVNGRNYLEYGEEEYRSLLSVVFQDVMVYGFMISENVSMRPYLVSDIPRVENALKKAGLYEKVLTLPNKVETNLVKRLNSDGIELSGGEKQKLVIARALYKNAPIMVLDEPTAALDALVESHIYKTFADMTAGKTTLFISHRLASTKFCDKVILLQNGQIMGIGTHEELIKENPLYAELYNFQAFGYSE